MQQIPSSGARVVFSTVPPPQPVHPLVVQIDSLIKTLSETPQDDMKYKALKEISESLNDLAAMPAYLSLVDNLIRVFIRLLQETSPQFIAENNTLQLRKLMLEMLLRFSSQDIMKSYGKSLQQLLLRLIHSENEENALIIIKILTDHIKTFRPGFTGEHSQFFVQWKSAYKEMFNHTANEAMFLQKPFITNNKTIEESVLEALKTCYATTTLSYSQEQQTPNVSSASMEKYTLIPKASQSVKVLAEMSVFLLVLIQAHRQQLLVEVLEVVPIFVRYVNICVPPHIRTDKLYNKELVEEFHNSQVRSLSFIAYTIRQNQVAEVINENVKSISEGILKLFDNFHAEVIGQRRELLMAIKYLFQCEFRASFLSIIPKMCNDKILLGSSFTSQDQLRNQAYSLLADILHHVRMNLDHKLLLHIFFVASRNLHDPQLLPYVQTMYGKLMMNLIEPLVIQQSDSDCPTHQEVLCVSIDSFVRKARTISERYLPFINEKFRPQQQQSAKEQQSEPASTGRNSNAEMAKALEASQQYWQDPRFPFTGRSHELNDCKNMVRFVLQPVKMMMIALKEMGIDPDMGRHLAQMMSKLFYHSLKCLDIFMIAANVLSGSGLYHQKSPTNMRSKEEKETIEAFIAIYTNLEQAVFEQIMEQHIESIVINLLTRLNRERHQIPLARFSFIVLLFGSRNWRGHQQSTGFLVARILVNPVLQNVCHTFFTQSSTASKMGTILVKFLLSKLPELGVNSEKAALYLKLFKVVFQAVGQRADSEAILKPFLHRIVRESMQLAINSRDSSNYFLLLRALFRSIGSGTHDLLYQQFLPLLPSILQQLNRLQNGSHRQPIHELFVELCLTVPVRLSSLLPYLPLLMDPLVCALNGSPTLVQQGLRTLELCVDNLQPEYFYEHMIPVRAALMDGLWRTVSCSDTQSALSALRILGKFGGSSRKVLLDAQAMDYRLLHDEDSSEMAFGFAKQDAEGAIATGQCCAFSFRECVQSAVSILRSQSDSGNGVNFALKVQALEFIKDVLLVAIRVDSFQPEGTRQTFAMAVTGVIAQKDDYSVGCCSTDKCSRDTFVAMLNGLFIAVSNQDTRPKCFTFYKALIKHLTVLAVLQSSKDSSNSDSLDASLLIDAIILTLGDSCKEYCQAGITALRILVDTTITLFGGNREKACQIPLFSLLLSKVVTLCYRREWFARLGGCTALRLIIESYPRKIVQDNFEAFIKACIEIISGLADELSSGALDFASKTIDILIGVCFPSEEVNEEGEAVLRRQQEALLSTLLDCLIDFVGDCEPILRKECVRVLHSVADRTKLSLIKIFEFCRGDPKQTLVSKMRDFAHISVDTKIATIEFYLFFSGIDNNLESCIPHKRLETFANNLLTICRSGNDVQLCQTLGISPPARGSSEETNLKSSSGTECSADDKLLTLRVAATSALIRLYLSLNAKGCHSSGGQAEDTMEICGNETDDIDLRGPRYLIDIFEHLIHCSLDSEDGVVRQTATEGIKRIMAEVPRSDQKTFASLKLEEFIDEFRCKKQFISKRFFDKLILLTKHSSGSVGPTDLQSFHRDLSLIMQTSASSLSISDIECVTKAVELFATLKYVNNDKLLKESIDFFSNCLFDFPEAMQKSWIDSILPFMSVLSIDSADAFLTKEMLADEKLARFLTVGFEWTIYFYRLLFLLWILISAEGALKLRESLLRNLNLVKPFVLELDTTDELEEVDPKLELYVLKFVSLLLAREKEWEFDDEILEEIFAAVRSIWGSTSFQTRHSVRKVMPPLECIGESVPETMNDFKTGTPAYCARILLSKLSSMLEAIQLGKQEDMHSSSPLIRESIDLLYDLMFAFAHTYAADFGFLRKFIDEEIIPKVSLVWRRAAFGKVVTLLREEPKSGYSVQLVCFMQYVVAPVFAYSFEVEEVDTVVGGPPQSDLQEQQQDDTNIVTLLCKEIIQRLTSDRTLASDALIIVMYLFCSLFVQKCSIHIYDPVKKQQGNRQEQGNLRHFMLFGWPCLQQSFQGDITEKFAGHFLIANIIDKFSINRTIILQVLNSLMQAHHHDNKEMVRKSLDILIPAVPRRMNDGYVQLQNLFKKVLVEESRNSAQVIHCLQIIIRHYKVFYHIRHQLAQLILNSLQRLFVLQAGFETRRLMLEVCDLAIKWEHERQSIIEENKRTALAAEEGEGEGEEEAASTAADKQQSTAAESSQQQPQHRDISQQPDLHRQMDKQFIDTIVMFLFRIATSAEQFTGSASGGATSMEQINRRAVLLLRSALKPNVFGNVATIRISQLEKQLQLPNTEQFSAGEQVITHQMGQVQITLDVLVNVMHYLTPQMVLDVFRPLQRALICCMSYTNSQQILRSTYNVLGKLLEKTKCSPNGLEELEMLNQHIIRCIHDSFGNYANAMTSSPPMTTITLLRLMHSSQPSYLETTCLNPFIKLLQRLVREYVVCSPGATSTIDQAVKLIGDLLAICLEMLCTRTKHFGAEPQRMVIQVVLIPLIEKNAVDKIVESIIKVTHEIIGTEIAFDNQQAAAQQSRHQSQGSIVLFKMFLSMEQRLASNGELQKHFLNAIITLYENEELLALNMAKLQPAFYWGLCSAGRETRNRYFAVFEKRFPKGTLPRLLHILSEENWQQMGRRFFWLAHVVHLLLLAETGSSMKGTIQLKGCPTFGNTLALVMAKSGSAIAREEPSMELTRKEVEEKMEVDGEKADKETERGQMESGNAPKQDEQQSEMDSADNATAQLARETASMRISFNESAAGDTKEQLTALFESQMGILSLSEEMDYAQTVASLVEILNSDATLCRKVFVELFASIWSTLNENERDQLARLAPPFLSSASLSLQKGADTQPSVAACFLEAFVRCSPPIKLDPFLLNYVGCTYNCWHSALLQLEQLAKGIKLAGDSALFSTSNEQHTEKLEVLDCLAKLYQQLNELDQHSAVWKKRAYYDKTIKCLAFYQQGEFHRAQEMAEKLMSQLNERLSKAVPSDPVSGISDAMYTEYQLWEQCCLNSLKQLNDWSSIADFANSPDVADASLLAESAWHLHDWKLLKDCLVQVDAAANPQMAIRTSMLKLMLNVSNFDQSEEHRPSKEAFDRSHISINKSLIDEWRKLPPIVSHSHIQILNSAHMVHEIVESAGVLHAPNFPGWNGNNGAHALNNSVRHIMKSWKSRPLSTVDQIGAWLALFNWRCQFFESIMRVYDNSDQSGAPSFSMHTLAQSQLQLARTLRRSNQVDLALAELKKLQSAVQISPMDCQSKLDEQIKCLRKISSGEAVCTSKKVTAQDALVEALETIEGTQMQYLKREQVARMMVSKGILLSRMDKREEAGRAFSASAQLDEMLPTPSVWKHWGDFLTSVYLANHTEGTTMSTGLQAIECTLEYARMCGPQKSRPAVAKLLWLLKIATSGNPTEKLLDALDELLSNNLDAVPPANWLFWLNEVIADLQQRPRNALGGVLRRLGEVYPQQVLTQIRTELGPRQTGDFIAKFIRHRQLSSADGAPQVGPTAATERHQQLYNVLEHICSRRPTDICTLNRMLDELDALPVCPVEAALNEMRQILMHCHFDQFTKITELSTVAMDGQLLSRLQNWLKTSVEPHAKSLDSEYNATFAGLLSDFSFCSGQSALLHTVASVLRKWIPVLIERLRKTMHKRERKLSELSPFLATFKSKMAQIDVFDGHYSMGISQYNAHISQFIPVFEEMVRNDSVYRVFRIRSLNGKIYSYQLERVRYDHAKGHIFKLFALLNTEFAKCRNTAQRFIQFAIPQILFTGANARLMECCPLAGISSQLQNANADHSSENFVVFADILDEMLRRDAIAKGDGATISPLAIVEHYYSRLAEQRYSHKSIHELFNQISGMKSEPSNSGIAPTVVPKELLLRWMASKYVEPVAFWTARKKIAIHFALLGLCEHAFFFSSMTPDSLFLDLSTAQLFFTDYKFDLTKKVCETLAGKVPFIELDANRPVPFRLTPNIAHFLDISVDGHLSGALTAVARSLNTRSLEVWLRPILWDVFAQVAEDDPQLSIANPVKRAVDTILSRIKVLSQCESVGTSASSQQVGHQQLVQQTQLPDNLCRMDPSLHPWF